MCLFGLRFIKIRKEVILPVYVLRTYFYFYRYTMCYCAIGCQHSIGCLVVFPGMTSSLAKSKQIIGAHFQTFLLQLSYFLMFLNIQIELTILKTYDQQFTSHPKIIAYDL